MKRTAIWRTTIWRTPLGLALALSALTSCSAAETPSGSATPGGAGTSASQSQSRSPENSGATVDLQLLSFKPETLTVRAGTEVTWRNGNDIAHTVTSGTYETAADTGLRTSEKADGTFDSRVAKKGDTVKHTFTRPGTYSYYCSIHKGMHATVVVTP